MTLKFKKLIHEFLPDSTLLSVTALTGGISAQTSLLEVKLSDAGIQKFVVRQHGEADRAANPNIAFDEYRLLEMLYTSDVPTAKPYHVTDTIFEHPCIVLAYVDGETIFDPDNLEDYIRQMADALVTIHSIADAATMFDFLPPQTNRYTGNLRHRPAQLDESLSEGRIRDALEAVWELPKVNGHVLLHGDYWTGNVLWRDDRLLAVIDWEDAMLGDPLADLGDIRIAILWSFGEKAMMQFTEHYQAQMPHLDYRYLPYWDLCAALRPIPRFSEWANDAEHEKSMRGYHQWFVEQALSNCSS